MKFKRITVFAGNFGSGKTELSINFAMNMAENFENIVLVDLDVVNPYFRSRQKDEFMKEKGVEVVFPRELQNADLPVITPDLYKVIQNENIHGVFDIGGDDDGAVALGSVSRQMKDEDYEMNLVVNTKRPYTSTFSGIKDMKERIEYSSKLSFDNIICNVNMGRETTVEDIKNGYPLVKEASKKLGLPIKFIVIRESLLPLPEDFQPEPEIFPINLHMNPPWVKNM